MSVEKIITLSKVNTVIYGFLFSATSPIVQLYFIKLIPEKMYAFSLLLATALMAIWNKFLAKEHIREKCHKIYILFLSIDAICYLILTIYTYYNLDATVRFICITITNSTLAVVAWTLLQDMWNQTLSGKELTNYQSSLSFYSQISAFIGGALAIYWIDNLGIHIALLIQLFMYIMASALEIAMYIALQKNLKGVACEQKAPV